MTAPDPWVAHTPPADPQYHLAADAGAWVPGIGTHNPDCESGWYEDMCEACREAADATRCRWCGGAGVYSDEAMSRECPWCKGDGESRDD